MTPKERVQKKYPKSFAFKYRFNEPSHRWHIYRINPIDFIANGPTAAAAWAAALQRMKK